MPPKASDIPPYETVEFVKEAFPIFCKVLSVPEIVLLVSVSVDVSVKTTPSIAIETLSAVTVVAIPVPPSTVIVSPKSTAWDPVSPETVIV